MHKTAMENGRRFFRTYAGERAVRIADLGAQDVNGSLREVAPPGCDYVGIDFAAGPGVDVVLDDPYTLPFAAGEFDIVVSSSCFEHSEFFWLTFLEALRILKPDGLLYLNVPSNGAFHRYPVDCWRFYPDSAIALRNWARRSGIDAEVLECYTGLQDGDCWNDLVGVFVRDRQFAARYPERIIDSMTAFYNGIAFPELSTIRSPELYTEDQEMLRYPTLQKRLRAKLKKALSR